MRRSTTRRVVEGEEWTTSFFRCSTAAICIGVMELQKICEMKRLGKPTAHTSLYNEPERAEWFDRD